MNQKIIPMVPKDALRLVAFTGPARSGKDTAMKIVADYMEDRNNLVPFEESHVFGGEAFAGPLKSMVAMLLDFFGLGNIMDRDTLVPYIDGDKKEEVIELIGASPRTLMQTLGTEWGRGMINDKLWLNCMQQRLKQYDLAPIHGYKGAVVVIPDCRFDNEAELVRDMGGLVIKLERPDSPTIGGVMHHTSEQGVSHNLIDQIIVNNGTTDDFRTMLLDALKDFLPPMPTEEELNGYPPEVMVDALANHANGVFVDHIEPAEPLWRPEPAELIHVVMDAAVGGGGADNWAQIHQPPDQVDAEIRQVLADMRREMEQRRAEVREMLEAGPERIREVGI